MWLCTDAAEQTWASSADTRMTFDKSDMAGEWWIISEMAILFTNSKLCGWSPGKIFCERMKPEGMQSYFEGTDFIVFSEGSSLPFCSHLLIARDQSGFFIFCQNGVASAATTPDFEVPLRKLQTCEFMLIKTLFLIGCQNLLPESPGNCWIAIKRRQVQWWRLNQKVFVVLSLEIITKIRF